MAIHDMRQDRDADNEPRTRVGLDATRREVRQRDEWRRSGTGGGDGERMARAIGWFSIGLGVAGVAAPRRVARWVGVSDDDDHRDALLAVGLREIASGIGVLTRPRPAGWLWARVGGDVMDLTLLGAAFRSDRTRRDRVALATAAVVGITALDLIAGRQLAGRQGGGRQAGAARERASRAPRDPSIRVTKAVTLNRPIEEVYRFWRDLRNLPRFMNHLESVEPIGEGLTHWRARGPAGKIVEWDAEITDDRPNELIAWRSLPGADVNNAGSVRFEPASGGRGTVVRVELRYVPPAGVFGATIAKLFGREPGQLVQENLRAFKQVMETGEVTRSEASFGRIRHPAQAPAGEAGWRGSIPV